MSRRPAPLTASFASVAMIRPPAANMPTPAPAPAVAVVPAEVPAPAPTPPATQQPSAPVAEMTREAFWRETFPALTIGGPLRNEVDGTALPADRLGVVGERMRVEGYFQESDAELVALSGLLADAIDRAAALSIPPVFVFLFDEAWRVFERQSATLASFLGEDFQVLPDFWAWRVDPQAGQAGWRPHRDKGHAGLRADGTPKSLTVWVPLTEAKPANGCMYILPADRDPVYGKPNDTQWQVDYPSIRALPGKPGDWFCWNQAVLHWGGQTSRFCQERRLSMALEFQRADEPAFNTPLLGTTPNLDFDMRLRLVAKQILQYQHMYPLPAPMQALAARILA